MKTLFSYALIALGLATADATPIDVGPNGFTFDRTARYADLNGAILSGQSLSIHLVFSQPIFIQQGVTRFDVTLSLQTDTPSPGFTLGTGFVNGIPVPTGHGESSRGTTFIGAFPFDFGSPFTKPFRLDEIRFHVTLPDSGAVIESGEIDFISLHDGKPFHIGSVPESGSTFLLLMLGLVGCASIQQKRLRHLRFSCRTLMEFRS